MVGVSVVVVGSELSLMFPPPLSFLLRWFVLQAERQEDVSVGGGGKVIATGQGDGQGVREIHLPCKQSNPQLLAPLLPARTSE